MAVNPENRPDPDTLLAHVQGEERQKHRGKLKIFFGYIAGVGKTYTGNVTKEIFSLQYFCRSSPCTWARSVLGSGTIFWIDCHKTRM